MILTGSVVAAVILFLVLLPTILSTQWGKGRILGMAIPHIPGEMSIDSWSLSWLGEQKLDGISYSDTQAGVEVDAAELSISKGLTSFLLDRGNMGTITLSRPVVQITLPAPVSKDGKPVQTPDNDKKPETTVKSPEANTDPTPAAGSLPPISGRLVVEQGTLAVVNPEKGSEPVAQDINMEIDIVSVDDPITFKLTTDSPDGAGNISGQGNVQLEPTDLSVASLRSAGEILVTGWNITQFLDLASAYGDLPTGTGILDSKITFDGEMVAGINVNGTMDLSNLQLAGGPLADDRPSVNKTSVQFSAVARSDSVELSSLQLSSPLASGNLAAHVGDSGAVQFSTDLQINLPEIASQLPHTLNLQEGLQITEGKLSLDANADLDQGQTRFTANASVENLAGTRDKKQISLSEAFTFSLKGQQGKGGLNLEHFAVQSSFLNGEGHGDLNDLQLTLEADLDAALKELSKFVSLQDYKATGRLNLTFGAKRSDDATVGVSAGLMSDKLAVTQGKTVIIPQNPLKLEADAALLLSQDFLFSGATDARLNYQAWLGSGSVEGHEILLDVEHKLEGIGGLIADGQIKLNALGTMLHSLGALPGEFSLAGNSQFKVKISGKADRYLVENFILDSPDLSLGKGGARLIPASPLNISGGGEIVIDANGGVASIDKPTLDYKSWIGSGTAQASALEVVSSRLTGLTYSGITDFGSLATLLDGLESLPPEFSLGGTGKTKLAMDYSPEQIGLTSLYAEIDDFVLKQEGKTYRDKRLVIDTAGSVDLEKRQVALRPVHINSVNGDISFEQLAIGDWEQLADTIDTNGQAKFDLSTILTAAADWVSLPPDVSSAARIDMNWNTEAKSSTEKNYRFNANLSDFSLARAAFQAFDKEQVSVQMNGTRNPSTGHVALEQFALSSAPLTFDAAGFLKNSTDDNTEFDFKGNVAMDLARIAGLIRTFTELDLEMTGKSESPFELAIKVNPEQREKWWQHTNFNTAFQADFIKMLGVELEKLEIPISVADGLGQAEIRGSANQGTLLLQPRLDLKSNPPLLTIPDESRVLDKMQITKDMANQLLARIHPLFQGATQMSGTFDLNLDQFSWPLGKENLNDLQFAGSMDFHDVTLNSSALLGSLLNVLRVEETGLDLSERQIRFACKDGRVETNPLKTNLSDSELIISGSLGLDTTIDYLAQAEVTERLVGGDLYNYLEGTVINVPIGGTLSNPDISAKTVQRAVTDLANQAGQKKLQEAAGSLLKGLFN